MFNNVNFLFISSYDNILNFKITHLEYIAELILL